MTPRSFVRWEGTRFHEDEIVQLVRGAVGAGERIIANMPSVQGHTDANEWFGLTDAELPIGAAYDWAVRANCGAVVLFSGTIRDHAEGREGVEYLTYEAYAEQVVPKFSEIG